MLYPDRMRALPDHRGEAIPGAANLSSGVAAASGASILRSRLFLKYVVLFVAVVSLALAANGAFDVYFSYQEQKASLVRIQREQAEAAAGKIGQFISEIQSQVGWTTQLPWSAGTLEQRRFDALRLLRQVPAITELAEIDATGHEQLRVSRLAMEVVGSGADLSTDPSFTEAVAHKVYFGPVYFRRESEPYMTLSLAGTRRDSGVSVAQVNLKLIWDVLSKIKFAGHGRAYVVDATGRLIAHPDISLVLRNTDMSQLAQVRSARAQAAGSDAEQVQEAEDIGGHRVLTAAAPVAPLGWLVFVETPVGEAYAPLYASLQRTAFVLLGALALAFAAGMFLARRMVVPIQTLRAGAARLGGGDLGQRIAIKTGDEVEALADQFNDMAGRLQESYAGLERKVEERTRELTESLEQQTATADVLKVISRSTFDLQTVLDTLTQSAARLCAADRGVIMQRDGDVYRAVTNYGYSREAAQYFAEHPVRPDQGSITGRAVLEGRAIHIADVLADPEYRLAGYQEAGGFRTVLGVPLLRQGTAIGVFILTRTEVNPFIAKQIELVTTFADQAVIAIENVRLFQAEQQRTRELTESLEQQTATSEVLQVISSSPGDLEPVFTSMLENAVRICDAKFGNIYRWDGEAFHIAAAHNTPAAFAAARKRATLRPSRDSSLGRMVATKAVTHVADLAADPSYGKRNPEAVAAVELGGVRTVLTVPMLKDNELVGSFSLFRQEVRPFSDKQITLVTSFAAQAVIAIENARLLSELRESLAQQTATSDVLRVISSSPGDLKPVFDALLANAARLCEAQFGNLLLCEGEAFRIGAMYNMPPVFAERWQREPVFRASPLAPVSRAVASKQFVQVADVTEEAAYKQGDPPIVSLVELGGARSLLTVPMLKEGQAIGVLSIFRREMRPFADKHIDLVKNFAAQAVIAIENARLLSELRQRTDELGRSVGELRALGEVSQAVNSTLDLETVLATIVAKAAQLSNTDAGAIYVYDDGQREFHLRATYGMDQELIDALSSRHIGLDDVNVSRALAQHEPTQIADLREEPANAINEITLRAGYRARLTAPLFRGEDIVGMLVVRRRTPGAFPPNTVDLIKTFAAQSVLAIQNARLFENVETRTRELTASLADLRTAQDRLIQTEKLASLGQLTAGIAHEIKNPLNFVNNFSAVSSELIDELREMIQDAEIDAKKRVEVDELARMLRGNLEKVVQHGKRADSIVKNMLLHSRQGSGEHRPADINAIVEESLNLAYHGARAEKQGFNITLERALDPTAGEVDVFPQEITRVLLNLIANGFYAATKRKTEEDGGEYEPKLAAATRNLGDSVEIRIRDNGTGIPPEVKEKMFNPFFTTKPAGEGTGLGLSLSHDIIVKQHAGSIEVDTEAGEFTEFRIVLPRKAAAIGQSGGNG